MLLASFLFALMGFFVKLLSQTMSSLEIVFFRNVFGVAMIGYSLYKVAPKTSGGKPFLLFMRGFIGFSALLLFFYNITVMTLADAMTFSKTSPIFTAIFAYLFLQEKLPKIASLSIVLGFVGMFMIIKPTAGMLDKTAITGILSGLGAALAYTSIRELKNYYEPRLIVMSFVLIGTIGPLILMGISEFYTNEVFDFMFSPFVMPSGVTWLYVIALGVLATFSQLFMTKSYATVKAGIAGVISYSNILFSIGIGVLIGEGLPDLMSAFGILLIIIGGILVTKK
jgi:drug/metabolite transporter (DMT)-like permease